jgi:hypothetical protein
MCVPNGQGLGASDCKRGLARDQRKSETANRSMAICGWALRPILGCAQSSVLQSDVPRPCTGTASGSKPCGSDVDWCSWPSKVAAAGPSISRPIPVHAKPQPALERKAMATPALPAFIKAPPTKTKSLHRSRAPIKIASLIPLGNVANGVRTIFCVHHTASHSH